MAEINKKLVKYATEAKFVEDLAGVADKINPKSVVFIEDTGRIWTHGKYYDGAWTGISGKPTTFAPAAHTLGSHSDVTLTSLAANNILKWSGSKWVNNTLAQAGIATPADISTAINGLEIGGRNLLHSGKITSLTNTTVNGEIYSLIKTEGTVDPYIRFDWRIFEKDKWYIVSFKAKKISGDVNVIGGHTYMTPVLSTERVYIDGALNGTSWADAVAYPNDTDEHLIEIHFKALTGVGANGWYIQPNRLSYGDLFELNIFDLQVREGTKFVSFSPAPEDQVSDWNESSTDSFAYIKNKPTKLTDFANDNTYALQSISIVAGNGLSGGGTLASTRTITLGTPSAITALSSNGVSAQTHTHLLQSSTVDLNTGLNTDIDGFVSGSTGSPRSGSVMGTWTTLRSSTSYGAGFFARANQAWFRTRESGVMQEWNEIYHTGNFIPGNYSGINHKHDASDITSGILNIARIPTGTTNSTVVIGNDSRVNNGQTAFGWGNHSGLYVPLSTSRISTSINDIKSSGFYSLGDALDRPTGSYAYSPLIVAQSSSDRFVQLYLDSWGGSDNIYYRNGNGSVWGSWNTIYHSGNLANGTTAQYIRGDGSLATYTNTTYTTGTVAQLNAGTDTTGRLQTAKLLNDWINGKGYITSYLDTTYTAGPGLTLSGTQFSLPVTVSGSGTYVSSVAHNTNGNGITVTLGTPPNTNTTYSAMSVAEGQTGTATSLRTMRADYLKQIIQYYDTNSVTGIRAGASGTTTNAAVASNPYIKVIDDSTYRSQIRLLGGGATTVKSDASGNVTISSSNTNTTYSAGTALTLSGTTFSVTSSGITATQLNVSGNGSTSQYLRSDGDGSFTWATPPNTVYTHPTDPGYKHIPSGGSTNQILRYSSSGTAVWSNENTGSSYTHPTTDGNKHVPATGTTNNGKVLKAGATAGSFSWGTLGYADVGAASSGHTHSNMVTTNTTQTISGTKTFSGNVTAAGFFQSSDIRLKNVIKPLKINIKDILNIPSFYFTYKDKERINIGTSAQEVQKVFPELVSTNSKGILSVEYDKFGLIALELIKTQQKEINDLKNELNLLKLKLTEYGYRN